MITGDELRAKQAPLKARYREDATAAQRTLRAQGDVGSESLTCKVETGRGVAVAGLHPLAGGDGLALCSGDMLLEALVGCAGVTLRAVAAALGVELRKATVSAEGDLDFRGTLAVSKDVSVGFSAIRLRFELDTGANSEQVASLLKLTERYCVILQSLKNPPSLLVTASGAGIPGPGSAVNAARTRAHGEE